MVVLEAPSLRSVGLVVPISHLTTFASTLWIAAADTALAAEKQIFCSKNIVKMCEKGVHIYVLYKNAQIVTTFFTYSPW